MLFLAVFMSYIYIVGRFSDNQIAQAVGNDLRSNERRTGA